MKILEQTSNKLVCRIQQDSNVDLIIWGLFWGLGSLVIIHIIFAVSGVEAITCKRVEPTQVNCELTHSTYIGLREERNILLSKVRGARTDEFHSEGDTSYQVVLLTKKDEVLLLNDNPNDASRINNFVNNPKSTYLTVKYDNRWQNLFEITFFLLFFVLIGFGVVGYSLYKTTIVRTYTFDKTLSKLTKQRQNLLGTQVNEYLLQEIIDVSVEEETASNGGRSYQVNLLLRGDDSRILRLYSSHCTSFNNGKREQKMAESVSQFFNFSKAK